MLNSYIFAKIYAWRGMLLPKSFMQELASSRSLSEFIDVLKATPYSQEVQAISPPYNSLKIEHALRRRLMKIHYRLMTVERKNPVLRALFTLHITRDFKIILRGVQAGLKGEELSGLIDPYAEELIGMRDILARLLSVESLEEASHIVRSYIAQETTPPAFGPVTDLAALEVQIDMWSLKGLRTAFKKIRRARRAGLEELLMPVFLKFILTSVLREKLWGFRVEEIEDMAGEVQDAPLRPVISVISGAERLEEIMKALSVLPKDMLPPLRDIKDLAGLIGSLERGYREMLVSRALKCFLRPFDDLSLPVAILFILEEEVSQLAALAVGIEQGVEADKLAERLIPLN